MTEKGVTADKEKLGREGGEVVIDKGHQNCVVLIVEEDFNKRLADPRVGPLENDGLNNLGITKNTDEIKPATGGTKENIVNHRSREYER